MRYLFFQRRSGTSGPKLRWRHGDDLLPLPTAAEDTPEGTDPAVESGAQTREQVEQGGAVVSAAGSRHAEGDRDATLVGQVGSPSTASATFTAAKFPRPAGSASPSFGLGGMGANDGGTCPGDALHLIPATGRTADAAGGAAATRGRRGRPRRSWRGSRATSNGRGAATNRGRIRRPGSSEPPSAPASRGGSEPPSAPRPRRGGGEESDLRKAEEGSEGEESASGSVGRLRAFIDASQDGVMCGGRRAAVTRGHRAVGLPCGHRHVMHAR